jgi:AraC-like DNA-binding protein
VSRHGPSPLFRALMAAAGTELEPAARDLLTPIVVRCDGFASRVAAHFGVSERHVRRLLSAYGWALCEQRQLAHAQPAGHYGQCRCVVCQQRRVAA